MSQSAVEKAKEVREKLLALPSNKAKEELKKIFEEKNASKGDEFLTELVKIISNDNELTAHCLKKEK